MVQNVDWKLFLIQLTVQIVCDCVPPYRRIYTFTRKPPSVDAPHSFV